MIEIGRLPAQRLITIRVSGKLTAEDYGKATPELAQAIEAADGNLNAVIEMDDMRGWDFEALWKEMKFDVNHHDDFRRIAVVGQTDAEQIGAEASSLLTRAAVEFFSFDELDEAREWAVAG